MRDKYNPYPFDFPKESQAKVEVEKIKARRVFDKAKEQVPATKWGSTGEVESLLKQYIMSVFSVFAHEACGLGRRGIWEVVPLHSQCEDFLNKIIIEVYAERGYDTNDHKMDSSGVKLRELKNSPEWEKYEDERLEVANLQSQGTSPASQSESVARRGYRAEVRAWMRKEGIKTVPQAAKKLFIGESTLKSIMANRGEIRYGPTTLADVLKKIGVDQQ